MTDKDFRTQRARVCAIIEKWIPVVGLNDWEVAHNFWREPNEHNDNDPLALATANSSWFYKRVSFHWYLPVVKSVDDNWALERHIVHELCHPLIDPLHIKSEDFDMDRLEFVTQAVADSLLRFEVLHKQYDSPSPGDIMKLQ